MSAHGSLSRPYTVASSRRTWLYVRVTHLGSHPVGGAMLKIRLRDPSENELGAAVREGLSKVREDDRRLRSMNRRTLASNAGGAVLFIGVPVALVLLLLFPLSFLAWNATGISILIGVPLALVALLVLLTSL